MGKIPDYKFIESENQFKDICDKISNEKVIGVDLEANSMHCFKQRICLIQIASQKQVFLIDPFKIKKIPFFLKLLENKDIIKVFHGSDYDIRCLDRDYNAKVNNLFDTEIAARFLGIRQRNLAALLKDKFDLNIDKRLQKCDWSKRPLTKEMIDYSALDVAYLIKLYKNIKEELIKKNRFGWAKEEFEAQEKVKHINYDLPLYKKFKGAGRIGKESLSVLENLLQLRILIAEKKDLPLFRIMSNKSLMIMAQKKPCTINKLIKTNVLSEKQLDMYAKDCVNAIRKALEKSNIQKIMSFNSNVSFPEKNDVDEKIVNSLKKLRKRLSQDLDIEPGFLFNNSLIKAISTDQPMSISKLLKVENIRKWQLENIGEEIINIVKKYKILTQGIE